ncbi:hypothetical protein ACRAWD_02355 [Caulobacter segnis]
MHAANDQIDPRSDLARRIEIEAIGIEADALIGRVDRDRRIALDDLARCGVEQRVRADSLARLRQAGGFRMISVRASL